MFFYLFSPLNFPLESVFLYYLFFVSFKLFLQLVLEFSKRPIILT